MNRLGAVFWLVLAMSSGFAMYMVKYGVQNLEDNLARVRRQTVAEQLEIRVLNAEWSYLTQPERLAELNKQFVSLTPIATKQLQQNIGDIPLRTLQPLPSAELSVEAAAPAPGPAPAPMLPGSNLPVTPVALSSSGTAVPQAARPTRGIDELFAQSAGGAGPQAVRAARPTRGIDELFAQIAGAR